MMMQGREAIHKRNTFCYSVCHIGDEPLFSQTVQSSRWVRKVGNQGRKSSGYMLEKSNRRFLSG